MANITKRGNSYLIRVCNGYDSKGKKMLKSLTWNPPVGMTQKQIDKELQRQAIFFEEKCKKGHILDGRMTLEKYINDIWYKDVSQNIKSTTLRRYNQLLKRIIPALGHYKLQVIQPFHLYSFYDNLREEKRNDTKYTPNEKAVKLSHTMTRPELAKYCDLSITTVDCIRAKKDVIQKTAESYSNAFNSSVSTLFTAKEKSLASRTILHHHRLLSTIFQQAVYDEVLESNPCSRTKPPRVEQYEARYLDEKQAEQLLTNIFENAKHPFDIIIPLILHTGMRRGEACGLEWDDIDFEKELISINRASLYLPDKGTFCDETKTYSSRRVIKVGSDIITLLKDFKVWQDNEACKLGDQWTNSNRLFTAWNGTPINPCTITSWFHHFIHNNNLPDCSIHSLRHTNASLLIFSGVPITTTSKRLGHSTTSTTTKIYAHAIASADETAASVIQSILPINQKK